VCTLFHEAGQRRWPRFRVGCTWLEQVCHHQLPDVSTGHDILQVVRWLRIVETVIDSDHQTTLSQLPAVVARNRRIGDPWFEPLAYVVVPPGSLVR